MRWSLARVLAFTVACLLAPQVAAAQIASLTTSGGSYTQTMWLTVPSRCARQG